MSGIFKIVLANTPKKEILKLYVKNVSSYCYKLANHELIKSGSLINDTQFSVKKKSSDSLEIDYIGVTKNVIPKYTSLNPNEDHLSGDINLSSSYHFKEGESYTICYNEDSLLQRACDNTYKAPQQTDIISSESQLCIDIDW